MADVDLTGKQGCSFNIDSNGSRINFGREVKSFVLSLPAENSVRLFYHIGQSKLATESDKSSAALKALYPSIIGEQSIEHDSEGVITCLDLCCPTGGSINDITIQLD